METKQVLVLALFYHPSLPREELSTLELHALEKFCTQLIIQSKMQKNTITTTNTKHALETIIGRS
jgi:hypothetical protein